MTAKIALASATDTMSFLVPGLGFANRRDAEACVKGDAVASLDGYYGGDQFEPLYLSERSYVPRLNSRSNTWETTQLYEWPLTTKATWEKLRDKATAKLPGAYNLGFMVDGPRAFFRHRRHTVKNPPYWYRIAEGLRDCYAAWSGFDGRTMRPILELPGEKTDADPSGNLRSRRVYAARSGRGVLFSRLGEYDHKGELCGFTTSVTRVDFSVLDRDPDRDDMLRVTVLRQFARSDRPDKMPTVDTEGMDAAWVMLVEKAQAGFERSCLPVPADVEEWRRMFVDQRTKAKYDSDDYNMRLTGESFRQRIEKLDWQAALAQVHEAWQMQVVVKAHCNSKFDDSPHRHDSTAHRVGVMLSRFEGSAARRAELSKMVSDFVAPCDKLWSYTGD